MLSYIEINATGSERHLRDGSAWQIPASYLILSQYFYSCQFLTIELREDEFGIQALSVLSGKPLAGVVT